MTSDDGGSTWTVSAEARTLTEDEIGAYIVHRNDADSPLLLPMDAANAGLEAVAEDGNTAPYPGAVPGAAIFNTPVGADAPGPIGPGGAYEFTVKAVDGDKLSFLTMFIPSNDWFYTPTDASKSNDPLLPLMGLLAGLFAWRRRIV